MTDELKPCPFCGGENLTVRKELLGRDVGFVKCRGCLCQGSYAAWNTRTLKATSDARVTELEWQIRGAGITEAENVLLRKRLIEVRNKALEEAAALADFRDEPLARHIRALKT